MNARDATLARLTRLHCRRSALDTRERASRPCHCARADKPRAFFVAAAAMARDVDALPSTAIGESGRSDSNNNTASIANNVAVTRVTSLPIQARSGRSGGDASAEPSPAPLSPSPFDRMASLRLDLDDKSV